MSQSHHLIATIATKANPLRSVTSMDSLDIAWELGSFSLHLAAMLSIVDGRNNPKSPKSP